MRIEKMKNFRLGILAGLLLSLPAVAAETGQPRAVQAQPDPLTLEQRLGRLERILKNQSLADIIMQLQQLQQEIQQMRGEMELQKHAMDALNKRQRDLYLDIDQRLSRMQTLPASPASQPLPQAVTPAASSEVAATSADAAQSGEAGAQTPPDPKLEAAAYQRAFNLLKQGRYPDSIKAFRDFLQQFPGGSYGDNAQYWLGEASYVSRDFDVALKEFSLVLEHYPSSSKLPGALLKSGYIHYEKHQWDEARRLFNRLQSEFSGSTEARLAAKRLERMEREGH